MPITEQQTSKFHPTERNKVLAAADVKIRQVHLVDKSGQIRSVVLWQCGSDVFYANNMECMFDVAQRKKAPSWLLEELETLPTDKQFSFTGEPKTKSKGYLPNDDDDVPSFVQG